MDFDALDLDHFEEDDVVLSPIDANRTSTAYSSLLKPSPLRRRRAFGRAVAEPTDHEPTSKEPATELPQLPTVSTTIDNESDEEELMLDDPEDKPATSDNDDDDKSLPGNQKEDDLANDDESLQESSQESAPHGRTKKSRDDLQQQQPTTSAPTKEAAEDDDETSQLETQAPFPPPATTTTEEAAVPNKEDDEEDDKSTASSSSPPTLSAILASTEQLFTEVEDKSTVTVKDILQALEAEFNCPIDKSTKKAVKAKLVELMTASAEEDEEEEDDQVSAGGEAESESEKEASDFDQGANDDGDDEDEDYNAKKSRGSRRKGSEAKVRATRRRASSGKKTSAMRIHAEKLRKRRMEELRVRNEELMLHQSKQDQERAEMIAAKFDTNTDELRVQRLEQRLGLLQKLDQKRFSVIQKEDAAANKDSESIKAEPEQTKEDIELSEEESDSDDDLEIVGKRTTSLMVSDQPSALSLLVLADRRMKAKVSEKPPSKPKTSSPGQSLDARAALKQKLLSKQRKMGNLWLARELGYKTEHEHLQDCLKVEQQKRKLMLKLEQERLKRNENRRELFLQEDAAEEDDGEANDSEEPATEEEEDEEMVLARELEKEGDSGTTPDPSDVVAAPASDADEDAMPEDEDAPVGSPVEGDGEDVAVPTFDDDEADDVPACDSHGTSQLETQAPFNPPPQLSASNDLPIPENVSADTVAAKEVTTTADGSPLMENDGVDKDDDNEEDGSEAEFDAKDEPVMPKGPRNAMWQAMLKKDAEQAKRKRKSGLVEEEADEEEEEEIVGLEDFGFSVHKKKKDDDDDEDKADDELDEDDLKHVVDELSDDEGDEDEGAKARKALEQKEEKDRHKEILRRMRDGYDGRRGGIAVGGAGARGMHRFDELVAADNREDAKRLGLLNEDEMDSDQEGEDKPDGDDEEEDEAALLDKMLKDRFLHRSSVDLEENFSDDEREDDQDNEGENGPGNEDDAEDKEQERVAKRFAKRARMQRLIEAHGHEEEFSQSKLIDEDTTLKSELQKMKNALARKRSSSTMSSQATVITNVTSKKQKTTVSFAGTLPKGGSLALALQANRSKNRTSFLRNSSAGSNNEATASFQKSISFNHVVFSTDSRSSFSNSAASRRGSGASSHAKARPLPARKEGKPAPGGSRTTSIWSKAVVSGFQKRR